MKLEKRQFEILVVLEAAQTLLSYPEIAKISGYDELVISDVMQELSILGLVENGMVTSAGMNTLEQYRVKRAVFIAAGLGTRLAPITINTPKPLVRVNGVRIIDRLIDACLAVDIGEIYIVRGYLSEQFDQLIYKYPMIRFLENPMYHEANNISSALVARELLPNAYVLEADLLLSNQKIITKYHYTSDFLAIKKAYTDDWCFKSEKGVIVEQNLGGENCWQMVGISYWNEDDGRKLAEDIASVYMSPEGKKRYWEQVPLRDRKENYVVEIRECFEEDVVEIDTLEELKAVDENYNI